MTADVAAIVIPLAMVAAAGWWILRDLRRWPVHVADQITRTEAKEQQP